MVNPELENLSREELLAYAEDMAKNWLAHDGLWFQAVERKFGLEAAVEMDIEAWRGFTQIEAKRIMRRFRIPEGSGLEGVKKALKYRLAASVNQYEISDEEDGSFVFKITKCRVQTARKRKGMEDFPCKSVGITEYVYFARTIDSRVKVECIACPPDSHPEEFWCGWRFFVEEE